MFGNLSLYVAQEHTMAALKNIHQANNQFSPYAAVEPVNNNMFDPMYHQLPTYQNYAAKDKQQPGRSDMHFYDSHRPLHFPTFHLGFPQRLPSPSRAPTWHQTTSVHQQAQMSLASDQESLQMPMPMAEKCPFVEDKKPKQCTSGVALSEHDITRSNEMEMASNKAWTTQAHNPVYFDQKNANGNFTNWLYENPNLVLGMFNSRGFNLLREFCISNLSCQHQEPGEEGVLTIQLCFIGVCATEQGKSLEATQIGYLFSQIMPQRGYAIFEKLVS